MVDAHETTVLDEGEHDITVSDGSIAEISNNEVSEADKIRYKDSTYEVVSKIAYLIGVPKRIFENEHDFLKIDSMLSGDIDGYENCSPDEIGAKYKDDPVMRLTEALVPSIVDTEVVQDTFEWARFINENGISDKLLNHPVVRLAERLFNEHRLLDYHRILFDIPYREKLVSE